MTGQRRRPSLLDPKSWEEEPLTQEEDDLEHAGWVRAKNIGPRRHSKALDDSLTASMAKSWVDHCACGRSLAGRRKGTKWCEPRCGVLWGKYGIGVTQYEQLFVGQKGLCAICKNRQNMQALAVDHSHITGRVRGLLCKKCNYDLLIAGKHNASIFEAAAHYLRQPPADSILAENG